MENDLSRKAILALVDEGCSGVIFSLLVAIDEGTALGPDHQLRFAVDGEIADSLKETDELWHDAYMQRLTDRLF